MKTKTLAATGLVLVFFITVVILSGYTQEDIEAVKDTAFEKRLRPPVSFLHDDHNEKAAIEECDACHHVFEKGKKVEGESSEGISCSECHTPEKAETPLSLVKIYHARCKGCHLEKKAGPIQCGECHRR